MNNGTMRAEQYRGYFDLQLRFAAKLCTVRGEDMSYGIETYTNLHRRFGFGVPRRPGVEVNARWLSFLDKINSYTHHAQRLDWAVAFFAEQCIESLPRENSFGCFGFMPPDDSGMVRIHFHNRDSDGGIGPLHHTKVGRRKLELARMWAYIREQFPAAKVVRGTSWLYHLDAYCRLFPATYTSSKVLVTHRLRFNGSSSWGQFLDHRGELKLPLAELFTDAIEKWDGHAPWLLFPYPALRTFAPLSCFTEGNSNEQLQP